MPILTRYLLALILVIIFGLFESCKEKPSETTLSEVDLSFEDKLIPAIQVTDNPVYFDLIERMKHFKVPGFSVAIIKNGELHSAKGYGFSRTDSELKIDINTRLQAASISKAITALTIIRLRDKGLVDLDANVEGYLKTWALPQNPFTESTPITLRLLLSHMAGVNNYNSKGYPQGEELPSLNDILNGNGKNKAVTIDTIPGSVYKYSNLGYSIVQKIIEDVTGESFVVVAENEVLEPLKMSASTFRTISPKNAKRSYSYGYNYEGEMLEGSWRNTIRKSAGGLWSTPSDLAKICIAVRKALKGDNDFLSANSAKDLMEGDFGLGFDVQKKNGNVLSFSQSGRAVGFFSYMIMHPKSGDGMVIMTNSDNGGDLFREILRGVSEFNSWDIMHPKEIQEILVPDNKLKTHLGDYICHFENEVWKLRVQKKGMHLELVDLDENLVYPLRPISDYKFIELTEGDELDFKVNENNAASLIWNGKYEFLKKEGD